MPLPDEGFEQPRHSPVLLAPVRRLDPERARELELLLIRSRQVLRVPERPPHRRGELLQRVREPEERLARRPPEADERPNGSTSAGPAASDRPRASARRARNSDSNASKVRERPHGPLRLVGDIQEPPLFHLRPGPGVCGRGEGGLELERSSEAERASCDDTPAGERVGAGATSPSGAFAAGAAFSGGVGAGPFSLGRSSHRAAATRRVAR